MKKKVLAVLVSATMVFALAACGTADSSSTGESGSSGGEAASDGTYTIAFSQGDNGNSWRVTSTNDMEETAE